jgi:hypothetical protein
MSINKDGGQIWVAMALQVPSVFHVSFQHFTQEHIPIQGTIASWYILFLLARIQQNSDTRARQLVLWCNLVLAYYKHKKMYVFDVNEAQTSSLFFNKEINSILFVSCCLECPFSAQSTFVHYNYKLSYCLYNFNVLSYKIKHY